MRHDENREGREEREWESSRLESSWRLKRSITARRDPFKRGGGRRVGSEKSERQFKQRSEWGASGERSIVRNLCMDHFKQYYQERVGGEWGG